MVISKTHRTLLSIFLSAIIISTLICPYSVSAKKDEEEAFKNYVGGIYTDIDPADATELTSGETLEGDSSVEPFDLYKIQSDGSDTLTIYLSCKFKCVNLYLFDKKGKYVDYDTITIEDGYIENTDDTEKIYAWSNDTNSPLRFDICVTYEIKKGSYYIVVNPGWQDVTYGGPYRITAALSDDEIDDPELSYLYEEESFSGYIAGIYTAVDPEDGMDIESDEEYEGNTKDNKFDLYKIAASDDDVLSIYLSIKAPNVNMYVFDRKGKYVPFTEIEIEDGYIENTDQDKIYAWSDDTSSPLRFDIEAEYEVHEGIYYIVICPGWQDVDYGGKYDLSVTLDKGSVPPEDRGASTSKKSSDKKDVTQLTYMNYSFEVPDFWCDIYDNEGDMYIYTESEYVFPVIYIFYDPISTLDIDDTSTYKKSVKALKTINEEAMDILFEGAELEESEERYIAGYPAITTRGTIEFDGTNNVYSALFIDDENVYYIIMIDYDDAEVDLFADMEDILDSFEEIE